MSDTAHIRDLLTPEEYAEHQRLVALLEQARSSAPMSQKQIADLLGLSQQSVSLIERTAKWKVRDQLTKDTDLTNLLPN